MCLSLRSVRTSVAGILLLPAFLPLCFAQSEKAGFYTIHKIVFKGNTAYSQAALEAAAGLKPGSGLTDAELQASAEKLIATGAFADVGATLDGAKKSVDVVFKVQPVGPDHLLRASFDNFVWFSREELSAELQRRVPLFNGVVPEGGNVQDDVQAALKQMLAAKGVMAKVSSQLMGAQAGQPFRVAEYRVESPSVLVRRVEVAGAPPPFSQATDKVAHDLAGSPYNDGLVAGLSERILADYRNAGYQAAALTGVETTIVSTDPAKVEVNVKATVQAGEPYRLSTLTWAGSPQMSSASFASKAKLHAGDVASQKSLRESLENLEAAYRDQGYVDATVDATPKLDAAAHQVAFEVSAIPGVQYKLRQMTVQGLTPAQRKEFDSAWRLHAGDVYDAGYVRSFLLNNTSLQTLAQMSASFKVNQDPDAGVIDLSVLFFKAAGK